MRFVRLVAALLLLGSGVAVAVAVSSGAAADTGTPTIGVDTTFNGGNPVSLTFPKPIGQTGSSTFMEATAVARQSDGKVVVGGSNSVNNVDDFDVARLNADGSLDTSFGTGGYADIQPVAGAQNYIFGIAIQPDGKIVLAGTSGFSKLVLVRLTTSGVLDPTFNAGGATPGILIDSSTGGAFGVALDGSGNIDVPTTSGGVNRYTPAGAADTTFNTTGRSPSLMDQARGIAIQPDGKIVIAGSTGFAPSSAIVGRVNSDGSTDTGFGTNGATNITPGGSDEGLNSVALEGSDILVGGEVNQGDGGLIARLTSAGALDSSFGTGGRIVDSTSGDTTGAIFYSPHPLIISVANDSDESQGDTPQDDTDAQVCIRDTSTGEPFHCLPQSDVEAGSYQTGAQSVNANGSTLDPAGSSSDGSHATVGPQILTFDLPPGTTTTGNTETIPTTTTTPPTTTTQKCSIPTDADTYIPRPCADLSISGGVVPYWYSAEYFVLNKMRTLPRSQQQAVQKKLFSVSNHKAAMIWPTVYWEWVQIANAGDDAGTCFYRINYSYSCPTLAPGTSWVWWWWWRVAAPGVYWRTESLFLETQPDPRLSNNSDSFHIYVYGALPVTKVKATARRFSGGADAQPAKHAPAAPSPGGEDSGPIDKKAYPLKLVKSIPESRSELAQVEIAVLREDADTKVVKSVIESKSCNWLSGPEPSFARNDSILGVCLDPHWLKASGTSDWSYNLSHPLPSGDYVLLVRTVDKAGAASSIFTPGSNTFVEFHVG